MRYIAIVSRVILGIVFIFSGFVKAVDPMGSAYKFSEYFDVFSLSFLDSLALFTSISLSALEFIIGIGLLLGLKIIISVWGGFLFMLFFTPLTLYIAITNPVADCGCFGDVLIITNWQTFYKNIFLFAFASIAFCYRKKFKPWFCCKVEWGILIVFAIFSVGISVYGLRHLPIIDFLGWKVGSNMKVDTSIKDEYYLIYKNKNTGETQEFLSPNYPWKDSVWMAEWEFVEQRVVMAPKPDNYLYIQDSYREDVSCFLTQNPDFNFMLVVDDIDETNIVAFEKINEFANKAIEKGIYFYALTGNAPNKAKGFADKIDAPYEFYFADGTILKTVIRSNPGLLLLKDATILAKWSYRDIPDFEKLEDKYITD